MDVCIFEIFVFFNNCLWVRWGNEVLLRDLVLFMIVCFFILFFDWNVLNVDFWLVVVEVLFLFCINLVWMLSREVVFVIEL